MLGESKEDYVVVTSDLGGLVDYLESGELSPDAGWASISKVLVLSDVGQSSVQPDDDDEYTATEFIERLEEMNEHYGVNCLELALQTFEKVILRLSMSNIGHLTIFQVLCLYYMSESEHFAYSRGELSELKNVEDDEIRFNFEFSDVLRAVRYCTVASGSDGLVCKTLKVSNSRGAIGVVGDYLSKQNGDSRDDVYSQTDDTELLQLRSDLDAANVHAQDLESERDELKAQIERIKEERDSAIDRVSTQLTQAKSELFEATSAKKTLEDKVVQLTEQLTMPTGASSISEYSTIATQNVKVCAVGHILYFKELSYVLGVASALDIFMNKVVADGKTCRMLIFDDTYYIEGKYNTNIPVVSYKDYSADKARYQQNQVVVITSRVISPIEDYMQMDVDVLLIYDRLGARNDMITGATVTRFIVANASKDIARAQTLFGVNNCSEIICSAVSSAIYRNTDLLGMTTSPRYLNSVKANKGIMGQQAAARTIQIGKTPLEGNGGAKASLVDVLADKCGFTFI